MIKLLTWFCRIDQKKVAFYECDINKLLTMHNGHTQFRQDLANVNIPFCVKTLSLAPL